MVGRGRLAVVFPNGGPGPRYAADVPFLDAGALGAQPPLLDVMRRFAPSLMVHVQDWTTDHSAPLGVRFVESFQLDPDVHRALPRSGRGGRFSGERRAFQQAASGPDWLVGARAIDDLRRRGHVLRDFTRPSGVTADTVHAIAPNRYVPALAYRRMGGGNAAELALMSCGAHGVTVQLQGGDVLARVSLALAAAEAVIVHRMGLAGEEKGE